MPILTTINYNLYEKIRLNNVNSKKVYYQLHKQATVKKFFQNI